MQVNKVYQGNNIDVLKTFPDNSIDSIVTDPPYGLGKEPDAIKVLQDWITTGYHEIGGKGFMGKEWDSFVPQPIFWKECLRVLKPGGHLLSFAGTRTYDWVVIGLRIAGFEIRDQIAWLYGSGFPKSLDISKAIDKKMGAKREVVGHRKVSKSDLGQNSGWNKLDTSSGNYDYTAPSTDQAKQWQGWGTALKPALEPIVMARKPLDGTVADNVLKHGAGGINIDGCRVATDEKWNGRDLPNAKDGVTWGGALNSSSSHELGRFPANVIHDGSDEVVSLFPNTNSSIASDYNFDKSNNDNVIKITNNIKSGVHYDDNGGSASRFFYTAKASQSERNFGLGGFEEVRHADRNKDDGVGGDNPRNRTNKSKRNFHPTVKPIDLMQYLVRLVTPKGGVCLDPFLGSGTTAVACKAEKFDYIGIELDPEYVKIAEARISAEVIKYDIFDFMEDGETP